MQADHAFLRLRQAADSDLPQILRAAVLRDGEGDAVALHRDAVLQGVQGLLGGELCLLAGHQGGDQQGAGQGKAHQGGAVALFPEQVAQTGFQLPLAAAEPGGQGHPPPGGGAQEHRAVPAAEGLVPPPHHRVVAAQLQAAARLPAHPPHQGVEPVDGAGQEQQGLIGHVVPFQVGELVAEHHLQLLRRQRPLRQQKHRPRQPQHHGGGRVRRAEQGRRPPHPQPGGQGRQEGGLLL